MNTVIHGSLSQLVELIADNESVKETVRIIETMGFINIVESQLDNLPIEKIKNCLDLNLQTTRAYLNQLLRDADTALFRSALDALWKTSYIRIADSDVLIRYINLLKN